MKNSLYLLLLPLLVWGCNEQKSIRYTVASRDADCIGVAPQRCLLVKKGNAQDWEYFYSPIEGFDYEPGYEYVLEVREEKIENVPADASSIRYFLVRQVSKIAKTSENLPVTVSPQAAPYQFAGRVMGIEKETVGVGAAQGKFEVTVLQIQVTARNTAGLEEGDIVYAELASAPGVWPEIGREYVFKARDIHPAHAKGKYFLNTDIMDMVV